MQCMLVLLAIATVKGSFTALYRGLAAATTNVICPALKPIWLRRLQSTIFNSNLKPPQASLYGSTKASAAQGTTFNINLKPTHADLHLYSSTIHRQAQYHKQLRDPGHNYACS